VVRQKKRNVLCITGNDIIKKRRKENEQGSQREEPHKVNNDSLFNIEGRKSLWIYVIRE
jgi:hypothetical protein